MYSEGYERREMDLEDLLGYCATGVSMRKMEKKSTRPNTRRSVFKREKTMADV